MTAQFAHRREAGRLLALKLRRLAHRSDVVVLALPRGGVPVAYEIAKALHVPLDVCLVRKLGVPGQEELAMGAIAPGGVRVLNQSLLRQLHLSDRSVARVEAQEQQELERRDRLYRRHRPPLNVENLTVVLVDDGIATGSTLKAAIALLKEQHPARIVVAVPVAPRETYREFQTEVAEVVCLRLPEPFHAIGLWYEDFSQTRDAEVIELLDAANREMVGIAPA